MNTKSRKSLIWAAIIFGALGIGAVIAGYIYCHNPLLYTLGGIFITVTVALPAFIPTKEESQDTGQMELLKEIRTMVEKKPAKKAPKWIQTVRNHIKKGELQQAIDSIDTEAADIEASEKHIIKAQLLRETGKYDEAGEHYIRASSIIPSYDNNFAVARFLQDQNWLEDAEDYYILCLNQATSPEERAKALGSLGNVQHDLNDYSQAEASLTEALQILKELAAKNPEAYLPHVATALNNLGLLQAKTNNYPQAEASYTEALQINRKLAATYPQAYLPDVATTLNNLGNLQSDNHDYSQAEASYTEALLTYRDLAGKNPEAYLPYVATILNNLGVLQADQNNYSQAEASLTKALQIRRDLAAKNPQAYLPDVAESLNSIGALQYKINDYVQAEESHTEALKIRKEFAETNPEAYLPYVAQALFNLSLLYKSGTPNKTLSLQCAKEAIGTLKQCNDTPEVQIYLENARQVIALWEGKN